MIDPCNASRHPARQPGTSIGGQRTLRKDRSRAPEHLGVGNSDTEADADYLVEKILGLRIFEDQTGKMNLSVVDTGGSMLVVSQFTLYGDVRRGKRPSFDDAAPADRGRHLYEYFVEKVRAASMVCETGRFRAMMKVELVNDGPVTILLDSAKIF